VNYLEIALEKPLDQATKDILTESHKASRSLIYVIDDLLHLTDSSYQAPLPMVYVNFRLSDSVMTTLDSLRKHARRKALFFNIDQAADLPLRLRGDPQRFQAAITHLVTNAIQYTDEGGVNIYVDARPTTDGVYLVTVTVQDTGTGMSEDGLNELFQEFEQVPDEDSGSEDSAVVENTGRSSTPKEKVMLGMGLALVARYIRQCGGQIRGQSTLGQGSTFALDVPLQPAKEDSISLPSALTTYHDFSDSKVSVCRQSPSAAGAMLSTLTTVAASSSNDSATASEVRSRAYADSDQHSKVNATNVSPIDTENKLPIPPQIEKLAMLVADDNSVNLSILKRRLENMGYDVKTSLDGQECFETFQEQYDSTDFILMDINVSRAHPAYRTMC
jgi:hypothetical protein